MDSEPAYLREMWLCQGGWKGRYVLMGLNESPFSAAQPTGQHGSYTFLLKRLSVVLQIHVVLHIHVVSCEQATVFKLQKRGLQEHMHV